MGISIPTFPTNKSGETLKKLALLLDCLVFKVTDYKVRDIKLADQGRLKIDWAESRMPVLMQLRKKFAKTKPLKGLKIHSFKKSPA